MNQLKLPQYPIPQDLKKVLDDDGKSFSSFSRRSRMYAKVLETLSNVKHVDLQECHYVQLCKLALYLEEDQRVRDMEKRAMFKQAIVKVTDPVTQLISFRISIEDLDEERPWIRLNDFVDVVDTTDYRSYTLKVRKVFESGILVRDACKIDRFSSVFSDKKLYNLKFRFQNYPLRCNHYALCLIQKNNITTYLFPQKCKSFIDLEKTTYDNLKMFNPSIESNSEQKQAIINIVNKSAFPAPYILYGPPGTGKTATLVEAICQIHHNLPGNRILVCTPSNTAADEVAKRLLKFLDCCDVYRIYSQSIDGLKIDAELRECANYGKGEIVKVTYENIVTKKIVITTLCAATRLIFLHLKDHFSHIIIDEAGQTTEPDILIPISLVSKLGVLQGQIVLSGDPQQLGPTVMSKPAEIILGRSILERLMSYGTYQKDYNNKYNSKYITKLLQNFRSHPSIIQISNNLFYDNELISKYLTHDKGSEFPIIFHGISGKEEKYTTTSSCNHKEIQIVVCYVEELLKNDKILAQDIGIITPFTLQSKEMKKALKKKELQSISVGTVELFQGQERKIIIMTTVRSRTFFSQDREHIGFLSNPKRFNVSLTRAKSLLIVVGNPNVLQVDDKWRYLLKCCIDNKSCVGLKFVLNDVDDEKRTISNAQTMVASSKLFKRQPFKLFSLDEIDSETEIRLTIDVILNGTVQDLEGRMQNLNLKQALLKYIRD